MGNQRKDSRGRQDAAEEVPATLSGRGRSAPLDWTEGIPRAREDVEPRRPGMDRREVENLLYWIRNSSDYDAKTLEALEHVHGGGAHCARLRFEIAFLIAEECLHYETKTGALAITEKGLDCLSFFEEVNRG